MINYSNKIIFMIVCLFATPWSPAAQEKEEDNSQVKLTGNIGFFYDYYNFSQNNYNSFRPRYPEHLWRINAQMNIHLGKHFSMPLSVNATNQDVLYTLPSVPEESALDYLQNPANNISINPKYKWAQVFLGTQTPFYSKLSTGDIPIFGVGIELNPGKFLFSATTGKSQRAIEPNVALNIPGAYEQNIIATRIGIGTIEGSKFTLNAIRIKDDVTSVSTQPIGLQPIEGITFSPYAEFKVFKKIQISTETAACVFTSDVLNTGTLEEDFVNSVKDIININASSTADFAHNSRIDWKGEIFQIGGELQYIGPGFLPVGYRFIERDILDYKLNTALKILKNKLNLTGSFGIRTNNLSDTKLSTARRVITNANAFAQINDAFSLNINFSNFGFNNDTNLLNQRIELVNNSLTISPSYTIKAEKYLHLITANASYNSFEQFDVINNAFAKAENTTYSLNYNLTFLQLPLNLGFQGIYLENELPTGDFNMLNYGLIASYKLLNKKLTPSLGFNIAHIDKPGFTTDYRTDLNLRIGYKISKKLQCRVQYRYTNLTYGSSRQEAILNQNRVQFSINQRF